MNHTCRRYFLQAVRLTPSRPRSNSPSAIDVGAIDVRRVSYNITGPVLKLSPMFVSIVMTGIYDHTNWTVSLSLGALPPEFMPRSAVATFTRYKWICVRVSACGAVESQATLRASEGFRSRTSRRNYGRGRRVHCARFCRSRRGLFDIGWISAFTDRLLVKQKS